MKLIKKILGIFADILICFVIVFALIISIITLTTNKDGVPSILGYSPFSIQSNSMLPVFEKGDIIIDKKYNGETINVGDIISFLASENTTKIIKTHRVVDISTDTGVYLYTTKGDNNDVNDSVMITDDEIVGIYTGKKVVKLGYVIDFLKSKYGFLIFIILPLSIIFIKELIDVYKLMLSYKLEEVKK